MKRLCISAALLLAIFVIPFFVYHIGATPERSVSKMLDSLGNGKISRAAKYTREGTLNTEGLNWTGRRFYKDMFRSITYTVISSEVTGDEARVSVAITMIDVDALLSEVSQESLGLSITGSSYQKLVRKRILSGEVAYVLNTVNVYLEKDRGSWKVIMDDSSRFAGAITGGRSELIGY